MSYPTRVLPLVAFTPTPAFEPHSPQQRLDIGSLLRQLGNPWAGLLRSRMLQPGDFREVVAVSGPRGIFRLPVSSDWRVTGLDGSDDIMLMLASRGRRGRCIVNLRTIPGQAYSSLELVEARQRMIAAKTSASLVETRSLSIGGKLANGLVMDVKQGSLGKRKFRVEEMFWSHSHPDWTWVIQAACFSDSFNDFQPEFEKPFLDWNP